MTFHNLVQAKHLTCIYIIFQSCIMNIIISSYVRFYLMPHFMIKQSISLYSKKKIRKQCAIFKYEHKRLYLPIRPFLRYTKTYVCSSFMEVDNVSKNKEQLPQTQEHRQGVNLHSFALNFCELRGFFLPEKKKSVIQSI